MTTFTVNQFADEIIVGISDLKVSNNKNSVIVTYSLGSCIGVTAYDPSVRVGGMLHFMLPASEINKSNDINPFKYADTGIPMLIKKCIDLGASPYRLVIKAAGGSNVMDPRGVFDIGAKNYVALVNMLNSMGLQIQADDVGGNRHRTLRLNILNGRLQIKYNSKDVYEI